MDPTLAGLLASLAGEGFKAHQAAMQAQTNNAQVIAQNIGLDHRMVTGWMMQQVAGAGTGDLNTISHIPGPQPWTAPNFVNPQGGPPATTPKTA